MPSPRTAPRVVATVAGLSAVLVLGGCGRGGPTTVSDQVLVAAANASMKATTAQMTLSMDEDLRGVSMPGVPTPLTSHLVMSMDGTVRMKPTMAGSITVTSMKVNGKDMPGPMQELVTPGAFFIKSPLFSTLSGGRWLEVRLADVPTTSGIDLKGMLQQAQQADPTQYLGYLVAAHKVVRVGTDTVSGVATTHYTGTLSVQDLLGEGTFKGAVAAQMRSLYAAMGVQQSVLDVWVDKDNLVRRMSSVSHSPKADITVDMTIEEYGVPVQVTPPPADQTYDFGAFLKAAAKHRG